MSAEPLVDVRDLSVAYRHDNGWLRVIDGVSFAIARGEAFGLVGESGCGKSTVAYHLLGYQRPTSRVEGGQVVHAGTDVLSLARPALDRLRGDRISLVPQNPTTALTPGMRVGEQIAEVLTQHRAEKSAADIAERTRELLGLVGLANVERIGRRYPHQLSGGQQQRVIVAMALACEPDLVVLDEPTTGLDVTTQEQIIALLRSLRARLGMSMLYVTHDLGVLAEIADRVGVMYAGQMVEIAPTAALFRQPHHPYTRGLIASIPQIDAGGSPRGRPLRGLLRREELPQGCPFQPRCEFAESSCAINRQRLVAVASEHEVACQRWQAIAAPTPVAPEAAATPSAQTPAPLLTLEGVTLGYGASTWLRLPRSNATAVVQELSFRIQRGEVFALVGESGSGKSTVARAISGLLTPAAGRIMFDGTPLPGSVRTRSGDLRRRIQYVFQNPDASLNPRLRVGRIIGRPLEMFEQLDRAAFKQRIAVALQDVRLDADYVVRYPDQLSGGERQRVAIARALVAKPDLLLCDEILSALDVSVQASVLALLRRLRQEHQLAMLFISHDLAVVRSLADRVGVLFRGHLMEVGRVADAFAPPFHPYTHSLLMAVPGTHAKQRREVDKMPMNPPPHAETGCAFAGRCPWQAGRICEEQAPPWRVTSSGLQIRCHLQLEELDRRAVWRPASAAEPSQDVREQAISSRELPHRRAKSEFPS
jgi:peptide/nickel transport system ATP-binding protein